MTGVEARDGRRVRHRAYRPPAFSHNTVSRERVDLPRPHFQAVDSVRDQNRKRPLAGPWSGWPELLWREPLGLAAHPPLQAGPDRSGGADCLTRSVPRAASPEGLADG